MTVKIFGVCGSPIKGGNTEVFLKEALKAAEKIGDVEIDMLSVAGKDIKDCRHCNWCISKQEEGKICALKDDMHEFYFKMLEADGILVASPVYIGRMSGYLANLIDRCRALVHGNYYGHRLKYKVGGALAVVWYRHSGAETTLLTINMAFGIYDMIVVYPGMVSAHGAAGVSSIGGVGEFDPGDKLQVLKDSWGLHSAHVLGERVAEVAKLIKAGKESVELVTKSHAS
jgi:multimeric flavodoxin WrbA